MWNRKLFLLLAFCLVTFGLGEELRTIPSCGSDQATCHSSDGIACCDMPLGVCCENGNTCCPFGFECDAKSDACISTDGGRTTQQQTLAPQHEIGNKAIKARASVGNATCTTNKCATDQTCCHDDWNCCPVPKAVCCKDKGHCCPQGYICDEQPFICRWPDDDHIIKTVEFQKLEKNKPIKCDDGVECPAGNTCCKLAEGSWGCCPIPMATCCDDGIHCCPQGSKCDTAHGRCILQPGLQSIPWVAKQSSQKVVDWMSKEPAISKAVSVGVQCDFSHSCPDDNTCCKLPSGLWKCCSLPNAVCCTGLGALGCCLSEETCCKRAPGHWVCCPSPNAVCCGDSGCCPSGQTCCPNASGNMECCHLPNAVCCKDGVHCCPSGSTCDPEGKCVQEGRQMLIAIATQP